MTVTAMPPKTDPAADAGKKGGKKKKLVIVAVLVLALGGAGYWFFLKPAPAGEAAPKPGEVLTLEPIQVNLSGGHYLKIGIALQLSAAAKEADGSKALDATIELFSGRPMESLTRSEDREKLKKVLEKELADRYEHEVIGVYFTDFVTQ